MAQAIGRISSTTFRSTFLFSAPELAKGLAVTAALPYVRKRVLSQIGTQQLDLRPEGMADIVLYARHPFYERESFGSSFQIAGIGGLKFPTGATDLKDRSGLQIAPPLQPGSGSLDYLLGLTAIRRSRRFSLFGESVYRLATEGDAEYRLGKLLSYRAGTRFLLFGQVSVLGEIDGEYAGRNALKGEPIPSTGGHTSFAAAGLDVGLGTRASLLFLFQYPIFQQLDGVQVETDYSLLFSGAFHLN